MNRSMLQKVNSLNLDAYANERAQMACNSNPLKAQLTKTEDTYTCDNHRQTLTTDNGWYTCTNYGDILSFVIRADKRVIPLSETQRNNPAFLPGLHGKYMQTVRTTVEAKEGDIVIVGSSKTARELRAILADRETLDGPAIATEVEGKLHG